MVHRLVVAALVSLTLACGGGAASGAGKTRFSQNCTDGGVDFECGTSTDFIALELRPGATGQAEVQLLAEGSHAGTYDLAVAPTEATVLSAQVSPTKAELLSGVPQVVTVSITAADDAMPGRSSVQVSAERTGSTSGKAGRTLRVQITAP